MARFEKSKGKEQRGGARRNSRKRENRTFEEYSRDRRGPRRDSNRRGSSRREVEMTRVTCSACGKKCEVPFKPTSSKPIYCDDCFAKKDKVNITQPSERDIDIINEKLNKIMKALNIK